MASQSGYLETEKNIIQNICLPNNCVYARNNGRCGTKYPDEAVIDFAGDGCQTAAQRNPSDISSFTDQYTSVIPGVMTREGFTPFSAAAITKAEHQAGMVSVQGKVIFPESK
ncbi:MAG: hypothetical protein AAB457_02325 [Patescibacteria group bacterium]